MAKRTLFLEAQRLFRSQKHGMDVVALALLRELQSRQFSDIDIRVLIKPDADVCLYSSPGFTVEPLPGGFYPLWEQRSLPTRMNRESNAWLHCTGNTAPLWGRTPLVVTIHDLIYLESNYLFKRDGGSWYQRFGNTYRRLVVPWVARRAKHIITVSEFQRVCIIDQLGIPPEKVSVVYNGADDDFFRMRNADELSAMREQLGITNAPYIFFLANTEPRKNTDGVLAAYRMLLQEQPDCPYHLVIKGLNDVLLEQKLAAHQLTMYRDRIHRVGYIDAALLPTVYQGAAMLWFPSFSEGFGLPIIEAMAGGVPVITSNCSVMPEIAGGAALLVDPAKANELVAATIQLWRDPALAHRLRLAGVDRAQAFTWRSAVDSLIDVYKRVGVMTNKG